MLRTDKITSAFWELICCGIWDTHPNTMLFDGLTSAEWKSIYQMISKHAVIGVTFPVLENLPMALKPQRRFYLEWCGMALHIKNSNQKMSDAYNRLYQWFEQGDVHPILLKGMGVAAWYPHPLLRITGDIDIYIRKDEYKKAIEMLHQATIDLKQTSEHDEFIFDGVQIELHTNTSHYGNIFEKQGIVTTMTEGEISYRVPSPEANALLLIQHPAKHLFTSGSAIRHLCDWALFLQKNHRQLAFDQVERALKEKSIEQFAMVFTSLAVNRLRLNSAVAPANWLSRSRKRQEKVLLHDLLEKGDCGIHYCHERHAMGHLSFSWNACIDWITYYRKAFFRLWRLSILFPEIMHSTINERIGHRIKMLIIGRPFEA